jgi:RNA polymerase sigma factor (sigma-70 family)
MKMLVWLRRTLKRGAARQRIREPAGPSLRLRRLFDGSHELVWRSLQRLGVPAHHLESSLQQVFRAVSERLDELEPGKEQCFMYGATVRVAREAIRTAASEALEAGPRAPRELSAEALVDRKQLVDAFDEILGRLTPELREALVLHEFAGSSVAEIASVLGMSQGGVRARLRRARAHVRAEIASLSETLSTSESHRG